MMIEVSNEPVSSYASVKPTANTTNGRNDGP